MYRRDNSLDNNNWLENNHLDGNQQVFLNLNLSSCSTVDSVLVKRRAFSMIKLLRLSHQFYNYLGETAKQFNDTANLIKNSDSARQINQIEAIKILNNLQIKNSQIRSQYEQKLEQTLLNGERNLKQMTLKAVKMKIMVQQFDENQTIRQVIHFFNAKKRNGLLKRQKQYLQKYEQKMELSNKIKCYDQKIENFSFQSQVSKPLQLEQENLNKSTVLSPPRQKILNTFGQTPTFQKITEENDNQRLIKNKTLIETKLFTKEESHQQDQFKKIKSQVRPLLSSSKKRQKKIDL